ncbi:unnamed protein product [Trichogramma brassicae]|uniref:Uncharacterized protein n=1 Tax=Trichogramma brassicae TaxID=86971 RepID=A0A6H5IGD1_9HYME|nr:unnamed protein product [Trichogramma brassicae]
MVLRFLFRYFSNNEQLVNKLADSKPIRRAAQMVVYFLNRTSTLSVGAAKKFSNDFKKELKEAQEELKKKQPK